MTDLLDYLNKPALSVYRQDYWNGSDVYDYAKLNTIVWKLDGTRKMIVETLTPFVSTQRLRLRSIVITKKVFYNIFTSKQRIDVDNLSEGDKAFILGCCALEISNIRKEVDFNKL
jgi:hypothetical protein